MRLDNNTALITGGGSGIGLALAERFVRSGSEVIICGRREDKLLEAQERHPSINIRVCDVAKEDERTELIEWAQNTFPRLNVLVNNAGVQRRIHIAGDQKRWKEAAEEIEINFAAPAHLSMLAIPHLMQQEQPRIINVTSGLAFAPLAIAPVYSATKAALHSFTLSLRHQLADTPIKVVEIVPPAVNTDLGGVGLHDFGEPLEEFADSIFEQLGLGHHEIAYGSAKTRANASREELDHAFSLINPSSKRV